MKYSDLDIHGRINLKGTYASFLRIAVERFRKEQDKKIYRYKNPVVKRKGRWVPGKPRTKALYDSFDTSYRAGITGSDTLTIQFLMYGRMVDMGVGRGVSVNYALVRRRFGARKTGITRRPKRWYSKRKRSEELRLGEILQERYKTGLIRLAESHLNHVITIPFS